MAVSLSARPLVVSSFSAPCSLRTSSSTRHQMGMFKLCPSSEDVQSPFSKNLQAFRRIIRQPLSVKQNCSTTICFAIPDLGASKPKIAPLTVKDAKVVVKPSQDKKLSIRVDVDGQASKRAFDAVLKDLAKNAPPVPGFRKAKGGKTSIVPLNVIYQLMGPKLVRKFVVEEIIKATLQDYVQKEGIKAKNEFKTDQSSEELDTVFEPGKAFGFDVTLDLADEKNQDSEAMVAVEKEDTVVQEVEATV